MPTPSGVLVPVTENSSSATPSPDRVMDSPLTEAARDALVMIDGQGFITFWNKAAEEMFGYRRKDILGQPAHLCLAPPGLEQKYLDTLTAFREGGGRTGGEATVELKAVRKDGSQVPVEISISGAELSGGWQGVAVIRDISDRKQTEAMLKATVSLLRATIESVAEALLVTDLKGRVMLYNSPFYRLWGFAEAGIGPDSPRNGFEHILSQLENPDDYLGRVRSMASERRSQSFDLLITKDGRFLELRSRPQYQDRQVIGRVWSFSDVTQRRQAEEELRRHRDHLSQLVEERTLKLSQANRDLEREIVDRLRIEEENLKLAALAENSGVLICLADFEGGLIFLNRAGRKMVGLENGGQTRLDHSMTDFFPDPGVKSMVGRIISRVGRGSRWSGELTLHNLATNRPMHTQADFFLVRHPTTGRGLCLGAVVRDIGDLLAAQDQVRFSERTVRSLMNAIGEVALVLGPWGEIIEINEAGAKLLETEPGELIGRDVLGLLPPELSQVFQDKMMQVLRSGTLVSFDDEQRDRITHFTISPIFDAFRRVHRLAVLGLDYTRMINYQRLIERKSNELSRSNADLEQFAYAASHDLQEPVRAVIGFLDLLVKRHGQLLNQDAQSFVDRARSAAGRMMAIIENLLDYSRVGTRGKPFQRVDLNRVVDQVKLILGRVIRQSEARVERGVLPVIRGDEAQLELLFQNLISNAVKFQPEGRRAIIRVGAERRAAGWQLWVEDNGIGIPVQERQRVFQVLSRLHSQSEYPGTGIGLAVCKRIVERHNGWIEVGAAGVGPGTRVSVFLPRDPRENIS